MEGRLRVTHRTNDTCTPRLRWIPLQLRQRKMPWFTEAHCGFRVWQSAHVCLSDTTRERQREGTQKQFVRRRGEVPTIEHKKQTTG